MLQRLHLACTPSRRCFALAVGAHTLRVWWLEGGIDPDEEGAECAYALEMDTGRMGIVGVTFLDETRLVVAHGDGCIQGWELTPTGEQSDPSVKSEHGDDLPERRQDLEEAGQFRRFDEEPIERASPSLRATLRWELDLEARLETCSFKRVTWGARALFGATDGGVYMVDLSAGYTPRATRLGAHDTSVILAAVAPDGGRLSTASRDRKLGVWRPNELVAPRGDGGAWRVLDESGGEVWAMAFSPSSRYLVSGGIDNGIYFWDLKAERALRAESHDHEGWIASLAWSEDERVIASASWDKTIGLFQAGDLKPLYCFEYHSDYVSQVMFVPGTNLLVSASYDKTVAVWDWRNAELIKVFSGHEDWIQTLMWLGDGMFCSASSDRTVRIWSTSTMTEVAVLGEGGADDWLSASLGSSFGLGGLSSLSERSSGFGSRRRVRGAGRSGPADEVLASLAEVEQHELGDDVSSYIEDEVMVLAAMASERASAESRVVEELEDVEEERFEMPEVGPRPVMFGDDLSDVDDEPVEQDEPLQIGNTASVSEDALLIEQALERLSFASDEGSEEEVEAEADAPVVEGEPGVVPEGEHDDVHEQAPTPHDDPTREISLEDVVKNLDKSSRAEGEESELEDEPEPELEPEAPALEELEPEESVPEASVPEESEPEVTPDVSAEAAPDEGAADDPSLDDRTTAEGDAVDLSGLAAVSRVEVSEADVLSVDDVADEEDEEGAAAEEAPAQRPRLPRPPAPLPPPVRVADEVSRPEVLSEAPGVSERLASEASEVEAPEAEDVVPEDLEVFDGELAARPSSGVHLSPPEAIEARYEVEGLGDRISSSVEDDSVVEPSLVTIDPDEASEPQPWSEGGPSSMSEPMGEDGGAVGAADEPVDEEADEEADEEGDEEVEGGVEPDEEDVPSPGQPLEQLAGANSSSAVEEIATELSGWADMGNRFQQQASKIAPASVVTDLDEMELMNLANPTLGGAELSMDHQPSEALQDVGQAFTLEREPTRRFQEPLSVGESFEPTIPEDLGEGRSRQTTREQVRAKLKERFASGKLSRLKSNLDTEFEEGVSPEPEPIAQEEAPAGELEVPIEEPSPLLAAPTPNLDEVHRAAPSFVSATSIERVATAELLHEWESESEIQILPDLTVSEDRGDMTVPDQTSSEIEVLPDEAPSLLLPEEASDVTVGRAKTESERIEFEPTEAEPPPPEERPEVGHSTPTPADTVERASRKQPSREELDAAFATMAPKAPDEEALEPVAQKPAFTPTPTPTSTPTPTPRARGDVSQGGSPIAKFLSPEEVAERSRPGINDLDVHGTVMGFGSPFMPHQDSSSFPAARTNAKRDEDRELFDVTVAEIWQLRLGQRRAAMKIFKKRSSAIKPFRSWERLEPELGEVYGLSSGGEVDYFAVCGARTRVDLWTGGARAFSLESGGTATLQAIAVSPDGRVVIAGDEDGGIQLWLLPAEPIEDRKASIGHAVMSGHTGPISSLALSSTGKMMATGSLDGTARLWDMVNGSCVAVLTRHRGPVTGVTFTSKGPVTISRDGSLRLWDKRGVLLSEAEGLGDLGAICSRKGKVYVGNGKGEVHAFQRGAVSKVLDVSDPIVSMAMSNEDVGVIGTRKGAVHVFEWGKTETLQTLQVGEGVSAVGATDKELLVGTITGAVEVYRQP